MVIDSKIKRNESIPDFEALYRNKGLTETNDKIHFIRQMAEKEADRDRIRNYS